MWGKVKKLLRPLRQGCNIIMCVEAAWSAARFGRRQVTDRGQDCLCGVYYPWRIQHICQGNIAGKLF
jgi:hypothetical protein